jgi:hypothetical protein
MKKVYIAGPYTKGDVAGNVRNAIHAADMVLTMGYLPFVPHLSHFWHLVSPKDYEEWLALDMEWLEVCDYFVRLEGDSRGADREEELAHRLNIPVFAGVDDFIDAMRRAP